MGLCPNQECWYSNTTCAALGNLCEYFTLLPSWYWPLFRLYMAIFQIWSWNKICQPLTKKAAKHWALCLDSPPKHPRRSADCEASRAGLRRSAKVLGVRPLLATSLGRLKIIGFLRLSHLVSPGNKPWLAGTSIIETSCPNANFYI